MKILVLNSGSSSIKYKLFDNLKEVKSGIFEEVKDYHSNIEKILKEIGEIDAVAHRVVHGGERFIESVLITDEVIEDIKKLIPLAPLHNPANLDGILSVKKLLPQISQIAVFDTAFHQTMPKYNYIYPIPYHLYKEKNIRKYGFHGTSHKYVANKASEILNKPLNELNLITCHLGNGASLCAVKNGKSINTSMGFSPLEGLMMGTRCGDIDPEIIFYLSKFISIDSIDVMLNKESGLKGIAGDNNLKNIEKRKDKLAKLAIDMFVSRVRKYVGAYMIELGRVDAVIFTGGIGENSSLIRKKVTQNLENYEIIIDKEKNKKNSVIISTGKVNVMVIPTNEELQIAKEAFELIKGDKNASN
jgi:acetate kinase